MKIGVLEGLLFVTGDDGLSLEDVVKLLEVSKDEALKLLEQYKKSLEFENRGLKLVYLGNKYKLTTKEEHKKYYELLVDKTVSGSLSQSALETLAIIAYNPRVTRAEIESIRGVSADACIYKLLEYGLIQEGGKADLPGKPMTYVTSNEFLKMFGYTSLNDLPELPRYKLDENQQIVIDDLVENSTEDIKKQEAPEPKREEEENK